MSLLYYKNRFETPLESLNRLRLERPELANETLSYAGRLDPMAEGVLLVLVGEEENRDRQKYLGLDKSYEVDILFGIATDSFDLLGLITHIDREKVDQTKAEEVLQTFLGSHEFPYPAFSSKVLSQKEGEEIPSRVMTLNSIHIEGWREVSGEEVKSLVAEACTKVTGDFRQPLILKSWNDVSDLSTLNFQLLTIRIDCASGAYMRTLAHELGKKIGTSALAYRIKRMGIAGFDCI
jgi:tRNA pseudouridine55 synthase